MAAGDNTATSIIWVAGESAGKDIYGVAHALPVDTDTADNTAANVYAAAQAAAVNTSLNVLHTRLVASGILPV